MTNLKPFLEMFQAIGIVIGWVLVIGGWVIVRHDNNAREHRHELRNAIDDLIKRIEELETKAYEYYQADANTDASLRQEVEIKRSQNTIESRLKRLKSITGGFQSQDAVTNFRQNLTGGDFETAARQKLPPRDKKLMEISSASSEFIEYLEREYTELYPNKSHRK